MPAVSPLRNDWQRAEIEALLALPFTELLHRAASVHREHFDPAEVQVSTLLSVKTGGCPEDCAYCPQAQRYHTGVEASKLMSTEAVLEKARQAKAAGASRFCMGAAWRSPKDRDIPKVAAMIREVKALGLETCATLGMLSGTQATALKSAGLDYYNHNLDTAPEFYGEIIHTREFQDRLDTLVARARRRHEDLLRRHRRHGRESRASAPACCRRWRTCRRIRIRCRSTAWCRSKARRWPARPNSIRSSSCARSRPRAS